jgi:hypothetical protein
VPLILSRLDRNGGDRGRRQLVQRLSTAADCEIGLIHQAAYFWVVVPDQSPGGHRRSRHAGPMEVPEERTDDNVYPRGAGRLEEHVDDPFGQPKRVRSARGDEDTRRRPGPQPIRRLAKRRTQQRIPCAEQQQAIGPRRVVESLRRQRSVDQNIDRQIGAEIVESRDEHAGRAQPFVERRCQLVRIADDGAGARFDGKANCLVRAGIAAHDVEALGLDQLRRVRIACEYEGRLEAPVGKDTRQRQTAAKVSQANRLRSLGPEDHIAPFGKPALFTAGNG